MTNRIAEMSPRRAARLAGAGYVAIFVLAIFANFVVVEGMIEPGDAGATARNILDSEGLFRLGLVAFIAIFVIDVVIAWALYIFFRPLSRDFSLLTAWFRLVYTVFLGVAAVFLFQALQLLSGADYLTVFDTGQLDAQALVALDLFDFTWLVGLVTFGAHLILLGYLVIRSEWVSRVLGYVLIVAGAAYIADTVARSLFSNYDDFDTLMLLIVALPSVVGELWLGLWLLLRAGSSAAGSDPVPGGAGAGH